MMGSLVRRLVVALVCVVAVARNATTTPRRLSSTTTGPLRLLYCITAFDRKQHVHLLQMLLSAVSMCEGGLVVRVLIYTADTNPYTELEALEFDHVAKTCTGRSGGAVEIVVEEHPASLRLEMTMQHRHEVKKRLQEFDVFVYAEDDVLIELRHVLAYVEASKKLAGSAAGKKYMLGWQRFEKTGIGMGARQIMWENGIDSWHAVEIGGDAYATMVNPHAGAWIATRDQLIALQRECNILRVPQTANSFTRVRAAGWNMYLNCGRRKVLPLRNFQAFIVHHLPDKNWWQRSECAVLVPDLLAHFHGWVTRYDRGDRSFLCGDWWTDHFCRDEMQVVPAGERKRRFGMQGSCTVWRNRTSGTETIVKPNEKLRSEGAVMRARETAARLEQKRQAQASSAQ
mmetsp:Transcript_14536/g.47364  ORF Transcript_14536/g.47364 Transcript_14536/m.47364 type:complete len:399 (+) Transcript_14536:1778-2974(+)